MYPTVSFMPLARPRSFGPKRSMQRRTVTDQHRPWRGKVGKESRRVRSSRAGLWAIPREADLLKPEKGGGRDHERPAGLGRRGRKDEQRGEEP